MANGMREKTTNVGGIIKRIWYAMTGATQGTELASLDDAGKFKCVSEQISGLAGTGTRMVVADSAGNLSATSIGIQKITTGIISSTSYVNLGVTLPAAIISLSNKIFIGFYNSVTGQTGCAEYIQTITTGLVQIAFSDSTSCGVSFALSGIELQAKVTSGSIICRVKVENLLV